MVILHELMHCFEPEYVDFEDEELLYCSSVDARRFDASLERVFEQGKTFEMMMYEEVVG